MTALRVQIPKKLIPVFAGPARYRGAYGGRGSAKTHSFCKMALAKAMERKRRIVCAREFQNSIKESSHAELKSCIEEMDLDRRFDVGESYIVDKVTRSEFLFKGLHKNPQSIKSIANIDILFVEEAEDVPEVSWREAIPSIRKAGSEIWAIWNPKSLDSATRKRFVLHTPRNAKIVKINWQDNPWFYETELNDERLNDLERDPDLYAHVWEGECITRSDAKVYNGKWEVRDFLPAKEWHGPYYGLDFGFSRDPCAGVKMWIYNNTLYVEREVGGVGIEIDALPKKLIEALPGVQFNPLLCDNARPESISYLSRHGIPKAEGAKKWPGSVEDGISFVRAFNKIVIHPRCQETIHEMDHYCYKVDRLTQRVTNELVDKDNHYCDAIRYGLTPLMRVEKQKLNIIMQGVR